MAERLGYDPRMIDSKSMSLPISLPLNEIAGQFPEPAYSIIYTHL